MLMMIHIIHHYTSTDEETSLVESPLEPPGKHCRLGVRL